MDMEMETWACETGGGHVRKSSRCNTGGICMNGYAETKKKRCLTIMGIGPKTNDGEKKALYDPI